MGAPGRQDKAKMVPKGSQGEPKYTPWEQRGPKIDHLGAPGTPQDASETPQEAPKTPQDAPEAPRHAPRQPRYTSRDSSHDARRPRHAQVRFSMVFSINTT